MRTIAIRISSAFAMCALLSAVGCAVETAGNADPEAEVGESRVTDTAAGTVTEVKTPRVRTSKVDEVGDTLVSSCPNGDIHCYCNGRLFCAAPAACEHICRN